MKPQLALFAVTLGAAPLLFEDCARPDPAAITAAIQAAPWDADTTGWGRLCTVQHPCDTVYIDPRVSLVPDRPSYFTPDDREIVLTLTVEDLRGIELGGREIVLRKWPEVPGDLGRTAQIAVGVIKTAPPSQDSLHVALSVLSPALPNAWPQLLATRVGGRWQARLEHYSAM